MQLKLIVIQMHQWSNDGYSPAVSIMVIMNGFSVVEGYTDTLYRMSSRFQNLRPFAGSFTYVNANFYKTKQQ